MSKGASKGSSKLKLTYFNGKGRAEHIRMLLAARGMDYEDIRVEFADWPKMKESTPCKSLPVVENKGMVFGQSIAIGRYVAKLTKFYSGTDEEQALIDEIVDSVTDLREALFGFALEKDEAKKAEAAKKFKETTMPNVLGNISNRLGKNQYFVGKSMTWADIHFFTYIEPVLGMFKDALDGYDNLKKLYERVGKDPKIAAYLKKRPTNTPF